MPSFLRLSNLNNIIPDPLEKQNIFDAKQKPIFSMNFSNIEETEDIDNRVYVDMRKKIKKLSKSKKAQFLSTFNK